MHWTRFEITKEPIPWTSRRLAAAKRSVDKERESMMFQELRRFHSVDERVTYIDDRAQKITTHLRAQRAKCWRKVRRQLEVLSPEARKRVLTKWNTKFTPGTPENLAYVIRVYSVNG
ncbi:MAG: hypothetical protein SFY80_10235 [Verrucomicrobiota bacterium]|nr:hypothetical protein [Verrucomicrobiota bacterium]